MFILDDNWNILFLGRNLQLNLGGSQVSVSADYIYCVDGKLDLLREAF